jgi:hypothetical protein
MSDIEAEPIRLWFEPDRIVIEGSWVAVPLTLRPGDSLHLAHSYRRVLVYYLLGDEEFPPETLTRLVRWGADRGLDLQQEDFLALLRILHGADLP